MKGCETDVDTREAEEVTASLLVLQHASLQVCGRVQRYQHHKL
jgi:hypothetical protein